MEEIKDLFSKHFNRTKQDLKAVKDVPPIVMLSISSNYKNLEQDVKQIIDDMEKKNGMDSNTNR